jgi:hypothetical protein
MAMYIQQFTSDQMKEKGRKGGSSRSEAKRAAARVNIKRANEVKAARRRGLVNG